MNVIQKLPRKNAASLAVLAAIVFGVVVSTAMTQDGANSTWVQCAEYIPARPSAAGPKECWMRETPGQFRGKPYRRVDVGLNGSVEGFSVKEGTRARYFVDRPEFSFTQWGQKDWQRGTAHYYASGGVGFTLVLPQANWNGKLFLHIHGAGTCARDGNPSPRQPDPADPLWDLSRFNELMLAKGYAVAATGPATTGTARLDTIPSGTGVCTRVELLDGTVRPNLNLTDHARFHVDLVRVAKGAVKSTLGRMPTRTYWYGHSSGARVNRVINYISEMNSDQDGKPLVDGFIGDDPAVGEWLPVRFEQDRDVLFTTSGEKQKFTKQMDITRQLFDEKRFDPGPAWVSNLAIVNKRSSAKHFRDKGMDDRYRMYEIRGISHSAGDGKASRLAPDVKILDLSPVIDALIDRLDAWVEQGTDPPPTRSDLPALASPDGDGVFEHEAVALPEVACPVGVYHAYPASSGHDGEGTTGLATFDGQGVEPVDGRGIFVDMNRNGYHDERESMTEAWRRLGLLKANESFTREKFIECVQAAASKLRSDGFVSEASVQTYIDRARDAELPGLAKGK